MRFYTLIFTGLMAIIYLIFNLLGWPGGDVCLFSGLITISIQSTLCFVTMKEKTWTAGLRALFTVLATLYLLYIFNY